MGYSLCVHKELDTTERLTLLLVGALCLSLSLARSLSLSLSIYIYIYISPIVKVISSAK